MASKNFFDNIVVNKNSIMQPHGPMQDADFSRKLGASRISVHWVELPPNERSSTPHAESHEEEFVYVASGNPHLWINGYIYKLKPDMIVGFPASTGICHSFINNTNEPVELIVLGEISKPENKYYYPLNSELKEEHKGSWWDNPPEQTFGPHDGKPGNLNHEKDFHELSFVKEIDFEGWKWTFSYPGDNEIFCIGIRLSDHVGLKTIGAWYHRMHEGQRSAWPHAHKVEEEFALILKGKAKAWVNGERKEMSRGDCAYFKPGTNLSHILLNDNPEIVHMFSIGEAADATPEKIFYPFHHHRNEECKKGNWYWDDRPAVPDFPRIRSIPNDSQIKIVEHNSVHDFLEQSRKLLYSKESEYGLILGLSETAAKATDKEDKNKYFSVQKNNEIIGAALLSHLNLVLTLTPEPALLPLAKRLADLRLQIPGVVGPVCTSEAFAGIWNELTSTTSTAALEQKIFELTEVKMPQKISGQFALAEMKHLDLLTKWIGEFRAEALPHEIATEEQNRQTAEVRIHNKSMYIWLNENNQPVSMNIISRPTQNGSSIGGVYTPPSERKKGYASALVAHTSQVILNNGKKFCTLYTDASNPTSNKIYQAIGYKEIGQSVNYKFSYN